MVKKKKKLPRDASLAVKLAEGSTVSCLFISISFFIYKVDHVMLENQLLLLLFVFIEVTTILVEVI